MSYVWGNPEKVHTLEFNGKEIGVTENLMFFLRRRWRYTIPHHFWIDTICISQDDNNECACRLFAKYIASKTGTMSRVYDASGVDSRRCIDVPTRP